MVARFGGEEFVVLLPETEKEGALQVAEKIRASVEAEDVKGEENQPGGRLRSAARISKWRWGPVARPVMPTLPSLFRLQTHWPSRTFVVDK